MTGIKRQLPWEFVWPIATAVALYLAKWPLLVLAAIIGLPVLFLNTVLYLAPRYPRTMFVLMALLRGFLRK
jgi:hypothetical protein